MKRTTAIASFVVLLVICLLAFYSYLSPQLTIKAIHEAAMNNDTETLNELIDFPMVKSNLKDELEAKLFADNNESGFAKLLAGTVLPGVIDMVVTPSSLSKMLSSNTDAANVDNQPNKNIQGTSPSTKFSFDGNYADLSRYLIVVHDDRDAGGAGLTLSLKRQGAFSWRVTRIGFPKGILGTALASKMPSQPAEARNKVSEGMALAGPAVVAVGTACSENSPQTMNNASLGLPESASISGRYTSSINVEGSQAHPVITITMKQVVNAIPGQTIVYTGTCRPDGLTWTVGGTVEKQYLPSH